MNSATFELHGEEYFCLHEAHDTYCSHTHDPDTRTCEHSSHLIMYARTSKSHPKSNEEIPESMYAVAPNSLLYI